MGRSSVAAIALAALCVGAAAQAPPAEPRNPLERALETVSARSLAADIGFLADDALAGRDSPSPGLRVAGNYLLARLAGLGFQPGTVSGYRHVFELESVRVDPERTHARWSDTPSELRYAVEFGVHPSDAVSRTTRGAVVFAGRGRRDDLEGCELEGRWALCIGQRYGRRRTLQRDVRAAGALGLICVAEPVPEPPEAPPSAFGRWRRMSVAVRPGRVPARERDDFAALWLTPAALPRVAGLEVGDLLAAELELEIAGGGRVEVENLAALWPGSDPERGHELIVLSAHYDHVGTNSAGEIMNGADDNASGSAALLAVAEALAARGPLERGVLLLWVAAEELGLLGSEAWCRDPRLPSGLVPVADINLDMVGRNAAEFLELTPGPEHEAYGPLAELAIAQAAEEGFAGPAFADSDFGRSDQASFHRLLGLPVVYLSTGDHGDYHEPGDDADRIDAHKTARVVRLVLRVLEQAQGLPLAARGPQPTVIHVGDEEDGDD